MESLEQWLAKLHKKQANDERNRRRFGGKKPDQQLPTKAHSKDN
ncbi:DUF4023 family protein [Paenibacillus koleovorans]|nr:DUF4023 family protein [Paenibacillus koleovorans]